METLSMTDQEMLQIVIGFLLPPLISIIKNKGWERQTKQLVAFLAVIPFAFLQCWIEDIITVGNIVRSFLMTLVISITVYNLYWKPSGNDEVVSTSIGTGMKKQKQLAARRAARKK